MNLIFFKGLSTGNLGLANHVIRLRSGLENWANPIYRPRVRSNASPSFALFFSGLDLAVLNGFWFYLYGFF
jgi:hypothetical protein